MTDHPPELSGHLPLRAGTTPLRARPPSTRIGWSRRCGTGQRRVLGRKNTIIDHADRYKDMPVYLVGGWYDSWAGNTTANISAHQGIKAPVYLIMGPWIHGSRANCPRPGRASAPEAAIADPLAWRLRVVRPLAEGHRQQRSVDGALRPPVRIFVMGTGDGRKRPTGLLNHGGAWRDEHEWPLARREADAYYCRRTAASTRAARRRIEPRRASPSTRGIRCRRSAATSRPGDGILLQGAWDQRRAATLWTRPEPSRCRPATTCWCSQPTPLEDDLEVTGEIAGEAVGRPRRRSTPTSRPS